MLKLGFIVEGKTEQIILESENFRQILENLELDYVEDVIDADGCGNVLPRNSDDEIESLLKQGATRILILTDQEGAPCITSVKQRVDPDGNNIVVIAVKAFEAWFLADTSAISTFMKHNLQCDKPEGISKPFEFIKTERLRLAGRGVRSKRLLYSRMLRSGFSIENAAHHPNCPSAKYFLNQLKQLATKQS